MLKTVIRKRKFLIGGLIVVLAIAYLAYMGIAGSATYYYSVSELIARGDLIYDENVRVNGLVAPGSVEQASQGRILRFTIADADGNGSIPVVYQGVVPDTFKAGSEVVAEGRLNSNGVFQASTIMAKCPSRYVPQ